MSDRLPPIPDAELSEAQAAAKAAVINGARGTFQGPFIPLLRSPVLMGRVDKLGEYLRYESKLPARIREFAICIVARQYSQNVEWAIHYPIALAAGVTEDSLAAIAQGRRPAALTEAETALWDFLSELTMHRGVSDATYGQAVREFGETGVIDLIGLAGYYAMIAMVMNVARTPAPDGPRLPALP
jgi:4-carboxymuconolactone decarboxylase